MMAHPRSRYRDAVFVPLSVLEFRDRAATFFGDKVGVIDGDEQYTYRAFGVRTHRLANALVGLGVEPGDRVSFITFNTHHLLEAYYGVIEAGAVLNPINIRLAPHEIEYILGHAASRVVFFHREFAPLVEGMASRLDPRPTFVQLDGESEQPGTVADHEYEALLATGSADPRHPDIDENALAELFYTSGTTGLPKGVAMTHRELYLHSLAAQIGLAFTEDDIVLHVVPLFHVNGWGTPHFLTMVGGRHVMLRRFDPTALMSLVERHRVTRLLAVPTIFNAVLNSRERSRFDLSSLRQLIIGGLARIARPRPSARSGHRGAGDRRLWPDRDVADHHPRPAAPGADRQRAGRAPPGAPGDDRLGDPRCPDPRRRWRGTGRPAGRRADRRDRRPWQHRDGWLLPRPGGDGGDDP